MNLQLDEDQQSISMMNTNKTTRKLTNCKQSGKKVGDHDMNDCVQKEQGGIDTFSQLTELYMEMYAFHSVCIKLRH